MKEGNRKDNGEFNNKEIVVKVLEKR